MSLEDLGNIGELVAAIGVIASLIYLAVQIRQNTQTVRASTVQAISDSAQGRLLALQNIENARVWRVGRSEPSELNEDEQTLYIFMIHSTVRGYENLYYQHRSGLLDAPQWEGYAKTIKALVKNPGFEYFWQHRRGHFSPEFESFIEESLSDS
jgi:hypothetical protein